MKRVLARMQGLLAERYGPTGWWPAETPFEVAVGAVLTQNTAWRNVEKAIANLKHTGLLDPHKLLDAAADEVEDAIRPSGYFRVKRERILAFCRYLVDHYEGSMERMAAVPLETLRAELLAVRGIGPETADDILLYACEKRVFVVDAYTRRILYRHGLAPQSIRYAALRNLLESNLPSDIELFKEYHAWLVFTGNAYCRARPQCAGCPLEPLLKPGQPLV